jgi:hypothetical protein
VVVASAAIAAEEQLDLLLTPPEVEVAPLHGHLVEAVDAGFEVAREAGVEREATRVRRETLESRRDLPGQRIERVAADQVVAFVDHAAVVADGARAGARERRHRPLVPDHRHQEPGVLAPLGVPLQERHRELVVDRLLVHHAAAVLVDPDHAVAGNGEHAAERVAAQRRLERERRHPGEVHVPQRQAERGRNPDEVALVALRRATADDHRREEVLAQLEVVREAAAREDHGLAGPEAPLAVGGARFHAQHGTVLADDHRLHPVLAMNRHSEALGGGDQLLGEHVALGELAVAAIDLQRAPVRNGFLGEVGVVVGDPRRVERHERAHLDQNVVGGGGVVVEGADHLVRPRRQAESLVVGVIRLRPREAGHVAKESVAVVLEPRLAHEPVVGDPVPSARLLHRPAGLGRLLQDDRVGPVAVGVQRRREAGRPRADHHDVGDAIPVATVAPHAAVALQSGSPLIAQSRVSVRREILHPSGPRRYSHS